MTKPKDWVLTCTSCVEKKKVTGLDEFRKHTDACAKQKAQVAKAVEAAAATAKANARRRRKHN